MTPVAEVGWPLTSMLGASDGTLFDLADRSANSTVEVCETIAMIIGHRSLKLQQGERSIDVDVRIFAPEGRTGWLVLSI